MNTIPRTLQRYLFHNSPRLFICNHLAGGLEEYLPPSFDERIGLGMHLDDLRLEFLLCSKEAVPEVVADRALLQQVLEGRFVLAYTKNALDVSDRPPHERGFQHGVWSGRVGTLKESDIGVSLDVSREIGLDLFAWRTCV